MVNDPVVFAEILSATWFGEQEIATISLDTGEVIFSVTLEDRDQVRPAWDAAQSVIGQTGRWAAISPGYSRQPELDLPQRRQHRLGDLAGPHAHIEGAARQAIEAIHRTRRATWPEQPLDQRIVEAHRQSTQRLVGVAPEPSEVVDALGADSPHAVVERWFLDWEDAHGEPLTTVELPKWSFWPGEPMLFFPTPNGPETLAYAPPYPGVPGASLDRVVAILEWWELRYQAELVANHGTIMDFIVRRPPETLEDAWEVTLEHELIAPDTFLLPGMPLRDYARGLVGHPTWSLHERP